MVSFEIGLVLLIFGIGLLVAESLHPGFFIAVPGTILIVMGLVIIVLPQIFDQWIGIIMVITALFSSIGTILLYRKIAPGQRPFATSMDSLGGKRGVVINDIEPGSIKGKVKISNQVWSATSDQAIPAGKNVEVVSSEGVHVKVKEITQ